MNNNQQQENAQGSIDLRKEQQTISTDEVGQVENVLQPIITNGMVSDPQFDQVEPMRCMIALKLSGLFNIHKDAIGHYTTGLQLMLAEAKDLSIHAVRDVAILSLRLAAYANTRDDTTKLTLGFQEVQLLKKAVESKMLHCEGQRETKDFNETSYINMKYLLLDIKTWLVGEILEYNESRK